VARPKKITHFKLREYLNTSGTKSWRVTGTKPDGTRVRQNFSDKSSAVQTQADFEAEVLGVKDAPRAQRTRLSTEELADAEAALVRAGDRRLTEIVSHYLALETRVRARGSQLDAAIEYFEAHYRSEFRNISVLNAYDEFIASRPDGPAKTKTHYVSSLNLLLKPDPNKLLHTFTVSDIEKVLKPYRNINSRKTYRRSFSVFFNWAVRHHYSLENPCHRLDRMPKDTTHVEILKIDDVQRLLYAAMNYQGGVAVAPIAIALFAGLRPSEIEELKPEDLGTERIRVAGGKLRRTLKRASPISHNLSEWLKKFPFKGLPDGWNYKMKRLKEATKASVWVQDILRHTSITYQAERDKNEAMTAFNCGTSPKMMDQHYRNFIDDPELIAKFWALTPENVLASKPRISLPNHKEIAWPTKAALTSLVWKKPLTHVAKEIGVSDVALRNHCVKMGLELPSKGHWARTRAR
jgi:integrase